MVPGKLTAAQIAPGLPPEGLGASVALLDHLSGDLVWYFGDPARCLFPVSERPAELPRTRVHVESEEEWIEVVDFPLRRRVIDFVEESDILVHSGHQVLQGAFMVTKAGRTLDDGRAVGRLIMDVRQTNSLMRVLEGDLDSMALPSQFITIVLEDGDVFGQLLLPVRDTLKVESLVRV